MRFCLSDLCLVSYNFLLLYKVLYFNLGAITTGNTQAWHDEPVVISVEPDYHSRQQR